jgi:hypothetical protein
VSGLYNGTADSTYTVIISRINKGDNCTLGSQLPRCFETNEFQWYVLYLLNYFCILMIVIKIVETFLNAFIIFFFVFVVIGVQMWAEELSVTSSKRDVTSPGV